MARAALTRGKSAQPRASAASRKSPQARTARTRPSATTPSKKTTAIAKPLTKAQLYSNLAEGAGLSKREVTAVMDELQLLMQRHLTKRGAGQFTLPGILKVSRVQKPRTKARLGRNPRTGEQITIAAKPARTTLRLRALKNLKEMVEAA
jgi:nucleoid DNA-binding protein